MKFDNGKLKRHICLCCLCISVCMNCVCAHVPVVCDDGVCVGGDDEGVVPHGWEAYLWCRYPPPRRSFLPVLPTDADTAHGGQFFNMYSFEITTSSTAHENNVGAWVRDVVHA